MKKNIYAEVVIEDGKVIINEDTDTNKVRSVTLIANSHRCIVRTAKLISKERLTPKTQWRLVQDHFPMGNLLNENTHIFDGSLFENISGEQCFLMVAIPKDISQAITEEAKVKWYSVYKFKALDTIEHILFRHYTNLKNKNPISEWIIFPQDAGFRVLVLEDGLPISAHYISNHPEYRESELERAWDTVKKVIILTRPFSDSTWIEQFMRSRGVDDISTEELLPINKFTQ